MAVLETKKISINLGQKDLVRKISFACGEGEIIGLIGPNGAGKTTLLKALAGLIAFSGEIFLKDRPFNQFSLTERGRILAYLPQNANIHWPLSVREIVALGRLPHRFGQHENTDKDQRAITRALEITDLVNFSERRSDQLSAGECARILLGRLLAVEADIILADEPVAALDPAYQLQIMHILVAEAKAGKTVIVVLHDLGLATQFCDKLLLLNDGELISFGAPKNVLTKRIVEKIYGITPAKKTGKANIVQPAWQLMDR